MEAPVTIAILISKLLPDFSRRFIFAGSTDGFWKGLRFLGNWRGFAGLWFLGGWRGFAGLWFLGGWRGFAGLRFLRKLTPSFF